MLQIIRYLLKGFRWQLLLLIGTGLGVVVASLLFIWFSKGVIDSATDAGQGDWLSYALMMGLCILAQVGFRLWNTSLMTRVSVRMGNAIRSKMFAHLLYAQWRQVGDLHSGDMLTRLMKDTSDVVQLLTSSLPTLIISGVQLLGALALAYVISPTMMLAVGVGLPVIMALSKIFYGRMIGFSREIKKTESEIYGHMQETLSNQTVVRTFERQEHEMDRLSLIQSRLYRTVSRRTQFSTYSSLVMQSGFSVSFFLVFLWGAWGLAQKTITFGMMTSFIQLITRIQRPLVDLMGLVPSSINAYAGLERLADLLDLQTESKRKARILSDGITLKFEDLSFAYSEDKPKIFDHFDFSISSGEMMAVMGPTGSGKTTLIRLLLGLISPTEGTISLSTDGEIIGVDESTRANFVYVPQGNSLLSGTIRDNLLVGSHEASDERLREVLKIAEADFVWSLPKGLDTELGERGLGLSEGQAQRLAIARSLLRPGRILLLDEATSALDTETARRFMENLSARIEGRIVLFITHDDSIAQRCSQVLRISPQA